MHSDQTREFEPTPDADACAAGGRSSAQSLGPVIWELPALVVRAWAALSAGLGLASLSTDLPGEGINWGWPQLFKEGCGGFQPSSH